MGIRWSAVEDLSVKVIGPLQDRTGADCDDDEVLHTEAGNVAVVIDDAALGETYVLEGTPGQVQFLADLIRSQARATRDDDPCPCGRSHTRSEHGYDPDKEH